MKRSIIPLVLALAFSSATLSAAPTADKAEEKKPSWIERIFGPKESKEEVEDKVESTEQAEAEESEAKKESVKADKAKKKSDKAKKDAKDLEFSEKDKEVLEDWQKGNTNWKKSKKKLPPGLQKKVDRGGELPPGWKKKLEVGSVLEPEVDEVAKTVPEEILARLPDIPEGTEILEVGGEIIRVIESTREIVDILSGIGATD